MMPLIPACSLGVGGGESGVFNLDRMQYQMDIFLRETSGRLCLFLRILKDIRTYRQTDIRRGIQKKETERTIETDIQRDRQTDISTDVQTERSYTHVVHINAGVML
jgi:hypothetical protein